jgi:hypothetical protein
MYRKTSFPLSCPKIVVGTYACWNIENIEIWIIETQLVERKSIKTQQIERRVAAFLMLLKEKKGRSKVAKIWKMLQEYLSTGRPTVRGRMDTSQHSIRQENKNTLAPKVM